MQKMVQNIKKLVYNINMQQQSTSLCDTKFKVVFLGDMGVGKTSIIERFVKDQFDPCNNVSLNYYMQPTVGIDFLTRNISFQNKTYRLQLWDTAGQQKYKSLVPAYLRDANCAVFVFDSSRPETFKNLPNWIQLYRDHESEMSVGFILGNKWDLVQNTVTDSAKDCEAEGKDFQMQVVQFAKNQNMTFRRVSAKTGRDVLNSFHNIILELVNGNNKPGQQVLLDAQTKLQRQVLQKISNLRLDDKQSGKANCCYI